MNNKYYPTIMTDNCITIIKDNKHFTANKDHINFEKIRARVKEVNYVGIEKLFEIAKTIKSKFQGVEVKNGGVYYKGEELHGVIVERILDFTKQGFPTKPLVNFLSKLMENPSFNSRTQLYSFLEKNNAPITENGNILFYKAVTNDYLDYHTNTFSNRPGATLKMDRSLCDDNPNNHCSVGWHVASHEFAKGFGREKYVICEVNPRDVVSVPSDHNCQKVRVCEYKVVSEVPGDKVVEFKNIYVKNENNSPRRDSRGRFVKAI